MLINVILSCAILFQFLAVIAALRLIKITGRAYSWIIISLALFLMMIRRIIPFYHRVFTKEAYSVDVTNEVIGLILSCFMFLGIVGIKQIFIARKKAEEKAKLSATLIHYLSKYANDFIILLDEKLHFIEVNERMLDFYGYKREEVIGMHASQLRAPEAKAAYAEQVKRAEVSGKALFETVHQRKDGKKFPVEISLRAINIEGKRLYQAVIRDITERKETERALQESERKYRELVQNANSIIMRFNSQGVITFMNEFGQEFFGYSEAEILGRHIVGTIVPHTESTGRDLRPLMDQICANPKAFEQNVNENMRRNGARVWIAWTNKAVFDRQGQIIEVFSIGSDITERKRAEEELERYREHLEDLVKERTQQLDILNRELVESNSKLQELDKLKSMFIASMSHELRTPLNSIIGFTGMTLQGLSGELNDEQKDNLARVYQAGKHLLAMITDVIDISKIEAGRIDSVPEVVLLHEIIDEAIATVKLPINEKRLTLSVNIPADVTLNTDRKRLLQCLLNLLSNGVKFTEKGGITIVAHKQNADIEISVTDTGIGIAEKDLPKLFEAFERLDTHLRVKVGGTGLGLYLTKKLVTDILHGSIMVQSREGQGSSFTVRIPLDLHQTGDTKKRRHAMKTALIIEDNPDNMVLITRLLEKAGYRTLQAINGREGFEMALGEKPDFIILDIQLPDMEGTEVLRKIRSSAIGNGISVIAMTSYAMSGDREKLLSAGCDGYIEKPIDPERVISQIKQLTGETP